MVDKKDYIYDVTVRGRLFTSNADSLRGTKNSFPTKLYDFRTVVKLSRVEAYFEAYVFIASILKELDKGIGIDNSKCFSLAQYFLDCTKSGGFKDQVKVNGELVPNSKAHLFCTGQCTKSEWWINVQRKSVNK